MRCTYPDCNCEGFCEQPVVTGKNSTAAILTGMDNTHVQPCVNPNLTIREQSEIYSEFIEEAYREGGPLYQFSPRGQPIPNTVEDWKYHCQLLGDLIEYQRDEIIRLKKGEAS